MPCPSDWGEKPLGEAVAYELSVETPCDFEEAVMAVLPERVHPEEPVEPAGVVHACMVEQGEEVWFVMEEVLVVVSSTIANDIPVIPIIGITDPSTKAVFGRKQKEVIPPCHDPIDQLSARSEVDEAVSLQF